MLTKYYSPVSVVSQAHSVNQTSIQSCLVVQLWHHPPHYVEWYSYRQWVYQQGCMNRLCEGAKECSSEYFVLSWSVSWCVWSSVLIFCYEYDVDHVYGKFFFCSHRISVCEDFGPTCRPEFTQQRCCNDIRDPKPKAQTNQQGLSNTAMWSESRAEGYQPG